MKRNELLRSPQWWLAEIQNDLYGVIYENMEKNGLKKKDIAEKLGVTRGYVTQLLNGNFDHKVSKLVEIALAFGKVPKVTYLDLEQYIKKDKTLTSENSFDFKDYLVNTPKRNENKPEIEPIYQPFRKTTGTIMQKI